MPGDRPETGHPLGLTACLLHEDGHAVTVAGQAGMIEQVQATADLFAELGLTVFRVAWLTPQDAVQRMVAGLGCPVCVARVSCGCDVVQDVLTGQCPHGTRQRIYDAATRVRYRERVPAPGDGTQASLDDWATRLVQADAASGGPRRRRGKRRGRR